MSKATTQLFAQAHLSSAQWSQGACDALVGTVQAMARDLERAAIGHSVKPGDLWRVIGFALNDQKVWTLLATEGQVPSRSPSITPDTQPGSPT